MALTVYQLKVVLRDVKPTVWRRVLVPCDATIRTLHETVQLVMGLANCHLHQFIIHGKEYGVAYEGGIRFVDSPDKVRLSDFRFQPHEGFEYVYDLGDNWEHDIGVEKTLHWTQRDHAPFALVERSLVRQKIPEALGAICLCGARENVTEGIGKRVRLARPMILSIIGLWAKHERRRSCAAIYTCFHCDARSTKGSMWSRTGTVPTASFFMAGAARSLPIASRIKRLLC